MVSLADYRRRHAQYKQDPDLQKLHAKAAFITTWDDHEVTNDQWRGGAENHNDGEGDYRARRARAHRAYDEWMPTRMGEAAEVGDGTRLYRRLRFGRLVELSMLDLRTYRSQQASTPPRAPSPPSTTPPAPSPGTARWRWLQAARWPQDRALWKVVGNPVMIAPVQFPPLPDGALTGRAGHHRAAARRTGVPYNVDQWDGYTADRREVLSPPARPRRARTRSSSPATSTRRGPATCPVDAGTYPAGSGSVGTEFVCTSVTSNNLDDITGTPATHHERRGRGGHQDRQPPREVPQLRRPRLLRRRHHPRAAPGRLLRHQRPRRPRRQRPTAPRAGRRGSTPSTCTRWRRGSTTDV